MEPPPSHLAIQTAFLIYEAEQRRRSPAFVGLALAWVRAVWAFRKYHLYCQEINGKWVGFL